MAVAGDVVIKLAADVAELKAGLADASQKLDEFGKAAKAVGDNMTVAATKGSVFGNLITKGIDVAVAEFRKLWTETENAALSAAKMAAQYGLTGEQVQALQRISEQTGRSMEDLVKTGKANVEWMNNVTTAAKQAGLVISEEFTSKLRELELQAEDADRKLRALLAPATTAVKSWIAESLEAMKLNLQAIAANEGILDKLIALITLGQSGGGVGGARANVMASLERSIETLKADVATYEGQLGSGRRLTPQETERFTNLLVEARQKLEAATRQRNLQLGQQTEGSPVVYQMPPIPVVAKAERGGGGRSDDDLMEAQIKRYEALAEAARKTGATISQYTGQNVDDLQRQLKVTQAIDDIVGKLGAKYDEADPKQKERLRTAVEADLIQRENNARALEYARQAEDIELRLGNATAQRLRTQRELARLQAAGLAGPALDRYRKQTEEANKLQELNAKRFDDSIGSMGAGFEAAAERYARAHDMFASGEAAFAGTIDALGQAFDTLAGKSQKSFEQIAADFATMLSKLAMQMAVSEAFKWLIKVAGASLSGPDITAAAAPAGGYSAGIDVNGNSWITPRAGGGDVYPGNTYRVGEYGPETFVPRAVGRIEPYSGNSQNGGSVTVNLDMKKAEGARDPTAAVEFGRRVKAAVQNVIENEKRPGGSLYSRSTLA